MYLSRTDQRTANRNALRIATANSNRALSGRSSLISGRETAVSALLAIDWGRGLACEVGSRPHLRPLRLLRSEDLPGDAYRIFAESIAHDADESNPAEHPNWLFSEGVNRPLSPPRGRGRDAVYFADRETRCSRYQDAALLGGIRLLGRFPNGVADS